MESVKTMQPHILGYVEALILNIIMLRATYVCYEFVSI